MTSFPCDPICVSGIARLTPTRTSPGGSSNRALPLFQTPSHLRSPSSVRHNDECWFIRTSTKYKYRMVREMRSRTTSANTRASRGILNLMLHVAKSVEAR
ncbi:hypothetical protein BO85DRAFT_453227 [Aspergillus piperis CBS 112811]|uniref:Uncharacterized protein n=2 Tax=Aspergillus subgen. Circumdati TaxID=2720871 RepID=A0A8G1VI91_9EURO|nr:hypothetical protein BO85DRAFT_453227 [Aspergillus piperis CBS 112811]OJZ85668.1 hypothetical protein ASPFODRAFT_46733 [Aspergillus luchuensis CBS 106.47]RAH53435.1 hypothetical protein BO85DRAFT_453227 [Aspergillus piperis CBS 112811]